MEKHKSLFEGKLEKRDFKKLNKRVGFLAFGGIVILMTFAILVFPSFRLNEEKPIKPEDKIIGKPELDSNKAVIEKDKVSDISGNVGTDTPAKTQSYLFENKKEETEDRESVKTELKRAVLGQIDEFHKIESAISNSDFEGAEKIASSAHSDSYSLPMYFIQGQGADPEFVKIVNLTSECAFQYVTATTSYLSSAKSYVTPELSAQFLQQGMSELQRAKKAKEYLFSQLTAF